MQNEKVEEFLTTFRELEEKLVNISNLNMDFVSFSRALDTCRNKRLIPLLSSNGNYKFLKTACDLRNMLTHQNDIAIPSDDFLNRFKYITKEIIDPIDVYDICIKKDKIVYAQLGSCVLDIIDMMVEAHLSHVPIMEKGKVIGVFSQNTFFQFVYNYRKLKVDDSFTIKDFVRKGEYQGINDNYLFISRNVKASSILKYLFKKQPIEKRTSVLFITEHGKKDEDLLGIITPIDILKIPAYKEYSIE